MKPDEYLDILPSAGKGHPKYCDFLRLLLDQVCGIANVAAAMPEAFSLDKAVGKQLDVLGELVQADRILPFTPISAPRKLSDDDYRLLIRAKIAQNGWDGTNESTFNMFQTIFPQFGITMEDGQNMSINVVIRGSFTDLQIEMINAGLLIPHPSGVTMTYEIPQTIVSTDIIVQAGVYQAGSIAIHAVT